MEPPRSLRIVHISDSHNFLREVSVVVAASVAGCRLHDRGCVGAQSMRLPRGDVLVHTGDFSTRGTAEEFESFNAWLETAPFATRVVCFGNHDVYQAGVCAARIPFLLSPSQATRGNIFLRV
jgi:3',5'-cyclic AMP phosphodiesterase CpdA